MKRILCLLLALGLCLLAAPSVRAETAQIPQAVEQARQSLVHLYGIGTDSETGRRSRWTGTGFAVGIERILLALEREGLAKPEAEKDVYVAYAPGMQQEAIRQVQAFRAEGKNCELAMAACLEQEADAYRKEKGYKELIFIKQG